MGPQRKNVVVVFSDAFQRLFQLSLLLPPNNQNKSKSSQTPLELSEAAIPRDVIHMQIIDDLTNFNAFLMIHIQREFAWDKGCRRNDVLVKTEWLEY